MAIIKWTLFIIGSFLLQNYSLMLRLFDDQAFGHGDYDNFFERQEDII